MVIYSDLQLDNIFGALANRTRREILNLLTRSEHSVLELAGRFDMSQPAVTKHLNVLERAGLMSQRKFGGKVGGPLVVARRAGKNFTFMELMHWFHIQQIIGFRGQESASSGICENAYQRFAAKLLILNPAQANDAVD